MADHQKPLTPVSSELADLLVEKALSAQKNSHSPYSRFPVGAALLTTSGEFFVGTNVENASFGGTICAEQSAIASAVSALGPARCKFRAIAIVANLERPTPPCGICRQVLVEFGDFQVIMHSPLSGQRLVSSVRELMPFAFTPTDMDESAKQTNGNSGGASVGHHAG